MEFGNDSFHRLVAWKLVATDLQQAAAGFIHAWRPCLMIKAESRDNLYA